MHRFPDVAVKPADGGRCHQGDDLVTLATQGEVSDLSGRVKSLEGEHARLDRGVGAQRKVAALEEKLSKISYEPKGLNGLPTIKISGANLQVVNGAGAIQNLNGLGNVIIGYDEHAADIKQTGSHDLVLGDRQTFTSWAGLLAGSKNSVTAPLGVSFGFANEVKARWATITGGYFNVAGGTGHRSAAVPRARPRPSSRRSAPGSTTMPMGTWSSVAGGLGNVAGGQYAAVGGGQQNGAPGKFSSVSGGEGNHAAGEASSILGGGDSPSLRSGVRARSWLRCSGAGRGRHRALLTAHCGAPAARPRMRESAWMQDSPLTGLLCLVLDA